MAKKGTVKQKSKEQEHNELNRVTEDKVILPQNVLKMGEQVLRDKNIYILQSVYKAIHEFTKDKLSVESGGMLMGYTLETNGKTNIIIEGFIEGKHSEGTLTTLKFTHETWEYVHSEAEKRFPKDRIIGWIHTHPNFGIFLSDYDKFIHENFFNDENQIAYVVDPIRHSEGFFFWINGQIEKCPGFYIYDSVGERISIDDIEDNRPVENVSDQMINTSKRKAESKINLLEVAIIAVLVCGFIILSLKIADLNHSINDLNERIITQNEELIQNDNALSDDISNIDGTIKKHTVVFLSDDGTIISKNLYETGERIMPPTESPDKPSDDYYSYVFTGWSGYDEYASGDAVITAKFEQQHRLYTITFEDEDGNIISSKQYLYGEEVSVPDYYPKTANTDGCDVSWDKSIDSVTKDVIYKAVISIKDDGSDYSGNTSVQSSND